MSGIEYPGSRLDRSTTSLMRTGNANGLSYHSFEITGSSLDEARVPCNPTTFVKFLSYYPRGVLSGDSMLGQIDGSAPFTEVSRRALIDVIEGEYDDQLRDGITLTERVEPIVALTRRASSEGVSLSELQTVMLREHSAPLAAVAIYAANDGYALQVMTPDFMRPWQALRMMREEMKSDSSEQ